MYSRYTPDGRGGFDRRRLPDRAEQGEPPPPAPMPGPLSPGPPPERAPLPPRPGPQGPRPQGPRFPGPPPNRPLGLRSGLLPRGLDAEDWLVLAVLLLAMKEDGAGSLELLLAAGLYLWL